MVGRYVEETEMLKKTPSSYDLNFKDIPGTIFIQVQLRCKNYDEWAKDIIFSLHAWRERGFVEGSVK